MQIVPSRVRSVSPMPALCAVNPYLLEIDPIMPNRPDPIASALNDLVDAADQAVKQIKVIGQIDFSELTDDADTFGLYLLLQGITDKLSLSVAAAEAVRLAAHDTEAAADTPPAACPGRRHSPTQDPRRIGESIIRDRADLRSVPLAISGALRLADAMSAEQEADPDDRPAWCNPYTIGALLKCARLAADHHYARLTDTIGEYDSDQRGK